MAVSETKLLLFYKILLMYLIKCRVYNVWLNPIPTSKFVLPETLFLIMNQQKKA